MSEMKQKIIGVCVGGIEEEYNDLFLHALKQYSREYNFKLLYFYSFSSLYVMESHDKGEKRIFQLINYDLLDGIILLGQSIKSAETLDEIVRTATAKNLPVVSIDCHLDDCYNINFNYDKPFEQIINHLIEEHHVTHLNFIAGIKGNDFSEHRLSIFRKILEEHNIPVEEERIGYGDFWYGPTNEVMDRFLSSELPFPEAIVCANDSMAITAYDRLTEAGYRVPEDILLTGFDGIQEALHHTPSLTTAKRDFEGTIRATFDIFSNLFNGNEQDDEVTVDSQLTLGGSCCHTATEHTLNERHNQLIRSMYSKADATNDFYARQLRMTADLTDRNSFQEIFDKIRLYADEFLEPSLWVCIVDNFLVEEEFSDILEESIYKRNGYSSKMDLMLYRKGREWQGIMDFETKNLLPDLEGILEEHDNIVFFPLHVHEQTIGYAALSPDDGKVNVRHCFQFFMNISIALEMTKSKNRQQTIIQNLENKYVHDPLTGLLNRRGFYQKVTEIYDTCTKNQTLIMIVSVDLNGLKPINDTYGHADGDIAISTVAKALMTCAGRAIVCARFGGDEFVVAGHLNKEEEGDKFINQVQDYLADFNKDSGKPYQVSASFGLIVAIPNEQFTLDEFISQADERMYAEKAKHHLSRSR